MLNPGFYLPGTPENMQWTAKEFPGYFGKKRDAIMKEWDEKYGKGNWELVWVWEVRDRFIIYVNKTVAIQLYEDAYYKHMTATWHDVQWLIQTASDVYDNDPSNVKSGIDYCKQENNSNHLQDIAIRRALLRMGWWFHGDHLVQVRGKETEGSRFSPYNIPFHLKNMIVPRPTNLYTNYPEWITPGSVEDFYQRNKLLRVKANPSG